ncbi:MAG TPA: ATP-binding protein [Marmoricola sp.]|nr:ATP-binding protein [Marmoricola sp.]
MSAAARGAGRPWWSALFVLATFGSDAASSIVAPSSPTALGWWWPGAGLGLLALLLATPRTWAWVTAGLVAAYAGAHLVAGADPVPALALAVPQAGGVLVTALWLHGVGAVTRLSRLRDVWHLLVAALVGGTTCGLGVGALSPQLLGVGFAPSVLLSAMGSITSMLVLAPLVLVAERSTWRFRPGTLLQLSFQALAFLAVTLLVFGPRSFLLVAFAPVPFLIWAAFQFGPRVVAVEQAAFAVLVSTFTQLDWGPFVAVTGGDPASYRYLVADLYLLCVVMTGLPLAVAEAERRRTLSRVAASEATFRNTFVGSLVPMLLLREERRGIVVVDANEAAMATLGPTTASLLGSPLDELLESTPPFLQVAQQVLSGEVDGWTGPVGVREHPRARLLMSLSPNSAGERERLLSAHLIDLTEAYEARERLREEKEFSEAVVDIAGSLIVVTELDGTVLLANPAVLNTTGFTRSQLVGQKVWDTLIPPEFREQAIKLFATTDDVAIRRELEIDVLTATGGRRRLELAGAIARDSQGMPAHFVITGTDVTAERESAGLVNHLLRSATTTGFIGTDLFGGITLFNTGAEQLLRVDAATAARYRITDFLDPGQLAQHAGDGSRPPGFDTLVEPVRAQGIPETRDWTLRSGTRELGTVSMTTNEVTDTFGHPIGFLFVLRDVTEARNSQSVLIKALDREREAVRQLQLLDSAKDEFVSTVSHELRTPMTSIIGYLEMLEDGLTGELTDGQQQVVHAISRNSDRLLTLADDLLLLTSYEPAMSHTGREPVDLAELTRAAVADLCDNASSRGIELHTTLPHQPVTVHATAADIERVLRNLIGNALKFTGPGGTVDVAVELLGDRAHLRVTDTGIGIPEDELGSVFDKFFRSRNAQHHAIQGTGLGLPIVQVIVESHGGEVSVASREGEGTTVTVELPVG